MVVILQKPIKGYIARLSAKAVEKAIKYYLDKTVRAKVKEYPEKVVANWKHKPKFQIRLKVGPTHATITGYPTGPNARYWNYVSKGTPGHWIPAKKKKGKRGGRHTLAYQVKYVPKTRPIGKYGGPGKHSGKWVYPLVVWHPGIKPRRFEVRWSKEISPWFKKGLTETLRNTVLWSGKR